METKINKPAKTSDKLGDAIAKNIVENVKGNTLCKGCKNLGKK